MNTDGRSPAANRLSLVVALCTYNGAAFLGEQLSSISGQSRLPDRMVIVDDCSRDDTVSILRKFAGTAPFSPVEVIVNAANLGYVKNFEKAIDLSEGDVVILSDQDDVWMPDRLQKIEQYLLAHPEMDAVFSDAELVDKELHPYAYTLWDSIEFNERERSMVASGNAFDVLLRRNVVTGATLAFRGHVKARVLPIPGEWVHDEWLAMIIAATGRLGFLPERLIRYRQHGANQIGARKLGLLEKFRLLFTRRADFHRNLYLKTQLLRVRLAELATATTASRLTQELDRKLDHLAARTRLPGPRFLRLGLVTKELVRGRYFRYSSGWKSVVRDLLEPL